MSGLDRLWVLTSCLIAGSLANNHLRAAILGALGLLALHYINEWQLRRRSKRDAP